MDYVLITYTVIIKKRINNHTYNLLKTTDKKVYSYSIG